MTTEDSGPSAAPPESVKQQETAPDNLSSQRVFKKTSPNNKLTMYLSSRDLVVSAGRIDRLQGVLLVDPEFVQDKKVYGQVTLTFRYGREDEEVMGLKFCNEAIMCLAQLYPPHPAAQPVEGNTPLQEALLKRLGPNAYPFSMEITPLAPPSVQLVPAKEYNGAPIGTSYDIRAYVADRADEKLHRRTTVRMGIRVVQRAYAPPSPHLYNPGVFSGTPKTYRERAKQHKLALFGCKSAPLEVKFPKGPPETEQDISCSLGSGLEKTRHATDTVSSKSYFKDDDKYRSTDVDNGERFELERKDADVQGDGETRIEETRAAETENEELSMSTPSKTSKPTHVSFKENLTNGTDQDQGGLSGDENMDSIEPCDHPEENEHESTALPEENVDQPEGGVQTDNNDSEKRITEQFRSLCGGKRPSLAAYLAGVPAPKAAVEKPFLLSDGKVYLSAGLDKAIYSHGEEIHVSVLVRNSSNKTIKRIKVFVVQHVDVCMFSNGKFKNVVAMINSKDDCPVSSSTTLQKTFTLLPIKSSTKNWIALEDSYTKSGTSLASTVTCSAHNPDERNVFAIYVSYYVKVKLVLSVMGGDVSLKLPFTLMHTCSEYEHAECLTKVNKPEDVQLELKSTEISSAVGIVNKQEKEGETT